MMGLTLLRNTRRGSLLLCSLCLLLAACRQQPGKIETSLYFGMSRPDGSVITDSAWQLFVREEVLRVFTDGFTVIPAQGMWLEKGQAFSERSAVVVSLNEMTEPLSARIDTLRERYKARFRQQSVMRADIPVARWDY